MSLTDTNCNARHWPQEKVRRCSPSSFSEEDQSAGQLFQELKTKLDFYKNASGPEAAEVCRLDALLNHNELNGFIQSCSRGQSDNQPSVSSANFSSWSELSNTSRSLCLLTSIQTSLRRLVNVLNPNHIPLTQCYDIKPKIWQAEEMVHFTMSISDQLNVRSHPISPLYSVYSSHHIVVQ